MLGASLRRHGVELLGRVENLEAAAESGSTAGIPLLHPWANRLAGLEYRAAGRDVRLDGASPILHFDSKGLPIHGVPWSKLSWDVTASRADTIEARLAWTRPELLAVFPFPHALELRATLTPGSLSLETTLVAGPRRRTARRRTRRGGACRVRLPPLFRTSRVAPAVAASAASDAPPRARCERHPDRPRGGRSRDGHSPRRRELGRRLRTRGRNRDARHLRRRPRDLGRFPRRLSVTRRSTRRPGSPSWPSSP